MKTTSAGKAPCFNSVILILIACLLFSGCFTYSRVIDPEKKLKDDSKASYLHYLLSANYYVILYHKGDAWHLLNLSEQAPATCTARIEKADGAYTGMYQKLSQQHISKYNSIEKPLLKQAAIFIADSLMVFSENQVTFKPETAKIEILKPDNYLIFYLVIVGSLAYFFTHFRVY